MNIKEMLKNILKKIYLYPILYKIKNIRSIALEKAYNLFFSRVVNGKLIVRVDNIPGQYELDSRSDLLKRILIKKHYEPEIVDAILRHLTKDGDAINIGANVGLYTNLLAQKIAPKNKILAVEPTNNAFDILLRNISINGNEAKVITHKGIISEVCGSYSVNVIPGKEEYSSIGNLVHSSVVNNSFQTEKAEGITLDEIVEKHNLRPKLIVMDVEGSEHKVFMGGIKTLKTYRPTIISELSDELLFAQGTNSVEVVKYLKELNYKVTDISGKMPTSPFNGNIIAKHKKD